MDNRAFGNLEFTINFVMEPEIQAINSGLFVEARHMFRAASDDMYSGLFGDMNWRQKPLIYVILCEADNYDSSWPWEG